MCKCKQPITVKVKKLYDDVILPEQATSGSAGFDLRVYLSLNKNDDNYIDWVWEERDDKMVRVMKLNPGERIKFETGIAFELPEDHVMFIHPRSSSGIKKQLRLQNSTGVLDSDYRNQCFLFIENTGHYIETIEHNERIAQAIIVPYPKVIFEESDELSETDRGLGGFGSTGRI